MRRTVNKRARYVGLLLVGAMALAGCADSSESSGIVRASRSRNFASFAGLSLETPSTSYPAPRRLSRESVKSQACLVQPGVIAAG